MVNLRTGLILALLGGLLPWGCRGREVSAEPSAPAPMRVGGILTETLAQAGLHAEWPGVQAPMGRARELKEIFYKEGQLYVLTDQNELIAYNGVTGGQKWSQAIAPPRMQNQPFSFWRDRLMVACGNRYVEILRGDGHILRELELESVATTGCARTEELIFVGCANRRFYALQENGIYRWQAIEQAAPVGPVALAGNRVFFCRQDGKLYVNETYTRNALWIKPTSGAVPGVAVDKGDCFLPSSDTSLYCYDPNSGQLKWKHMTGGELEELPALTASGIYQPVGRRSLLCLSRPDGNLRWELRKGRSLLAENGPVSYLITHDKELVVLDNTTGRTLMSFFVPDMDLFAVNTDDAMIFMASRYGAIIALKPDMIYQRPAAPAPVSPAPATPAPEQLLPSEAPAAPGEAAPVPAVPAEPAPSAPTEPAPSAPAEPAPAP